MDLFGSTRSRFCRDHALIASDSFVRAALPGWDNTQGVILISPQMGARFTQYLALMAPGVSAGQPLPGVERFLYVLEGQVALKVSREASQVLTSGGYAFIPPDVGISLRSKTAAKLNIFEKRYLPLPSGTPPRFLCGQEQSLKSVPFQGDPDAALKTLLPQELSFDLAVNIFTYRPGATLPQVEVHVMEHGLLMLEGRGIYRLGDSWYPVQQEDVIWMAPYCPQWFVAMGKDPARYLYYKDVNRDPLQNSA
jgi:(S)-ureidoglycine aminohydrolase